MANILYVDDDEMAITVISHFLKRTGDELITVSSADEALDLLSKSLYYDLLILETKLESGDATGMIAQIKKNPFLKSIPIVVYTKNKKKEAAKKITELDVQNYLMKPFKEDVLREEIDKAMKVDWRIKRSCDPEDFYKRANEDLDDFYKSNTRLAERMPEINQQISAAKAAEDILEFKDSVKIVLNSAEQAGFTAYAEMLSGIIKAADEIKWVDIQPVIPFLHTTELIQDYRLAVIELYLPKEESAEVEETEEAVEAEASDVESEIEEEEDEDREGKLPPAFSTMEIEEALGKVIDYPVIESAAATFAMIVNDEDTSLEDIVRIVGEDSGLATSVLKFSNSPVVAAASPSEDIERAVAVIGIKRVRTLATSLRTISEVSPMFSAFRWQDFWMHQVGCAILSEYIFEGLNLPGRSDIAYLGGLIHDIGKIILCEIDPEGYVKVLDSALQRQLPLAVVEKEHFTANFCSAGATFAEKSDLPEVIKSIMSNSQAPGGASEHVDVIGCISIADYLCKKYQVGFSGDHFLPQYTSLTDHPSWELLARWIPPSFETFKFIQGVEKRIFKLKQDLIGLIEGKN